MAYEKVKIGQTVDENNQIINNNFDESVNIAEKGIPDGIATLDSAGKVPSAQLPEIPMTAKDIKMTGYAKPSVTSAIVPTDSADAAIGKLERKADDHGESFIQAVMQLSGNISGLSTSITKANSDILNITTDVNKLRTDIDNLDVDIDNLDADVNQLRTDTDTNTTAISDLETDITAIDGRVTTLEQSGGGGSVTVDTALDINSNNAIANKAVAAKFIDADAKNQNLDDRITAAETDINDVRVNVGNIDTRLTEMEQGEGGTETTETDAIVTIDNMSGNTSFQAMTIYGKTTQIGTPSPDNPAPIIGVTNPVITVSNGTETQSVTLDGITLHSIDAASMVDTIEIANGTVTLTHRVAVMTDLNLFSIYPSGTTTTHTSIYIPTNEYLLGESNIYCNLLPNTNIGSNGYVSTAIAQNRIFINNVPNTLTGINGGDTTNNKTNALKAWLTARGIKILYAPKVAAVTDITNTPLGQALLGLHGYKGTTVIDFGGATGNVTYTVSGKSIYERLIYLENAVQALIDANI